MNHSAGQRLRAPGGRFLIAVTLLYLALVPSFDGCSRGCTVAACGRELPAVIDRGYICLTAPAEPAILGLAFCGGVAMEGAMIAAKTRRYLLSGLGLLSLLVFVLGLWSIEAYHVSGIGFNDPVDWAKLFAAFPGVNPMHLAKLKLEAVDWVAFPGMGFLGVFPLVCGKRIPFPLIVGYLIVLLACGGWIGALLTLGLPLSFDTTGEFFAENLPRFYGSGVLSLGIVAWISYRMIEKRKVRAAVLPRTDAVSV